MLKNFFLQKKVSRGIFMIAGLFVFFSAMNTYAACGTDTASRDGITYGTVLAEDGNCWLDRNLGATQVATTYNDTQAYGWYFQWGRDADGHQYSTSSTTTALSAVDTPGHSSFIKTMSAPYNWRSSRNNDLWQGTSGINNPCPIGWRLPNATEWTTLVSSAGITNYNTAFSSSLKLVAAGARGSGASLFNQNNAGMYWSSDIDVNLDYSTMMQIGAGSTVFYYPYFRSYAFSARCIKDAGPQDVIIPDPDTTKMNSAVTDGHITVDNGTINNTSQSTAQVGVTFQASSAEAFFPSNTVITEQGNGNFNLENFTIGDTTANNAIAAFELGIPGVNLSFSQDVAVTLNVGSEYNGQTLAVYSQSVGQTDWTDHGTCTVAEGDCTFTTDHATTYAVGGNPAAETININVEVQDTLSLDCYDTLGTSGDHTVQLTDSTTGTGLVVAGIPSVGRSTCNVTTNDDQGYFLTIDRSTEDVNWAGTNGSGIHAATNTLIHEDPNIDGTWYEIPDTGNGLSTYNGSNSTAWTEGTTKGLGFSVITFPDTNLTNNTLDNDWELTGTQCLDGTNAGTDTAKYAAVPTNAVPIAAVTQYEASQTSTTVCYKVDVLASQQSGQYAGQVTYTATSDASGYLN